MASPDFPPRRRFDARWLALLLAAAVGVGCPDGTPPAPPPGTAAALPPLPEGFSELRWGFQPYRDPALMREELQPFIDEVSKALGCPIELVIGEDYRETAEQLLSGQLDVANLSPLSYVLARRRAIDIPLLVTRIVGGSTHYRSYVVVRQDGPQSLEELAQRPFALVDRWSTSGFLFPRYVVKQAGLEPDGFYAGARFSGNHDRSLAWLRAGEVEGAAIDNSLYQDPSGGGPATDLRILAKSNPLPYDAIATRPDLPEGVARRLQQILLALHTRSDAGRRAFGEGRVVQGFTLGRAEDYDVVERMAVELGMVQR